MAVFRLFLDQNIRVTTAVFLRKLDHDVLTVRECRLERAEDQDILQYAHRERRIIVTFNGDLGDIRKFPIGTHSGIIRLRIDPQIDELVHPAMQRALEALQPDHIEGKLVTITPDRIRIRQQ